MGFNLKEKFQNVSKKNIAIVVSILFILAMCIIAGFEYYQYNTTKEKVTAAQEDILKSLSTLDEDGQPKKPSDYKIGIDYNKAIKGKKPILVLFYADWCHYCIKFMPVYQELSEKYKDTFEFSKVNVEDKKYERLVREIGITGFPTVFIIDPKYDNRILLSNAYLSKTELVSSELDRFLRIRKILDSKK